MKGLGEKLVTGSKRRRRKQIETIESTNRELIRHLLYENQGRLCFGYYSETWLLDETKSQSVHHENTAPISTTRNKTIYAPAVGLSQNYTVLK